MTTVKFLSQQQPVKILSDNTNIVVYIYANERLVDSVVCSETGNEEPVIYYEYDYNEFIENKDTFDVNELLSNPEAYVDYVPVDEELKNKEMQSAIYELARMQLTVLPDEQAIKVKVLFAEWNPSCNYTVGERCLYKNLLYKCLESHNSADDINPSESTHWELLG